MDLPPLHVILASPRGFCAGVRRAIEVVEQALLKYGAPVYVRHEIVHNRHVVEKLEHQGAVFVDKLSQVSASAPVIFSAHGVPKTVPSEARRRGMLFIDATCPLVSKVHNEAARFHEQGREILLIGHRGHPEVIGTMGQLPPGAVLLIQTAEDAANFKPRNKDRLAYLTQTTLSVDDTSDIVCILKRRFPSIEGPCRGDICYATSNRQDAVKAICNRCDVMLVVGSQNSSNSLRLVEVAEREGCRTTRLIEEVGDIDWSLLENAKVLGLTAGASTPEQLTENVIQALRTRFALSIEQISTTQENVAFNLPRMLAEERWLGKSAQLR